MPTYRSQFPDYIGMITKAGEKFNFVGGLLETDDASIIDILKERIEKYKDVSQISEEEAAGIRAHRIQSKSIEDRMNENTNGEDTISPAELMRRIQLAQEASAGQSAQLASPVLNPQTGIVSSATLEAANPSNASQAATRTITPGPVSTKR